MKLIKTLDGSHTLFIEELNEHYHSVNGAVQESKHVYINAGLKPILQKNNSLINIFEIGLGTGLNAFLTLIETQDLTTNINYTSVEPNPIPIEIVSALNYTEIFNLEKEKNIFSQIHNCEWEKEIILTDKFVLHKTKNTIQKFSSTKKFDLIYFDAFAPLVQPELWTNEIFSLLFSLTKTYGCLVTYCAKGEVKRNLKKSGYVVESLPGAAGKREMIRATRMN